VLGKFGTNIYICVYTDGNASAVAEIGHDLPAHQSHLWLKHPITDAGSFTVLTAYFRVTAVIQIGYNSSTGTHNNREKHL